MAITRGRSAQTYNAEDLAERWEAREIWDGAARPTRVEERFEELLLLVD